LGVIERVVGPARCPRAAAKKVALGHVFLFPSYAFLFNVWMGALEGKGAEGGVRKFVDTWAEVCVAGSVFWPAANMVNFMYCPPKHRVLFLNGGGLFWNAFLSYQNAKSNAKRSRLPLEGMKKHLA
jgi:protein Mpv17